MSTQIMITKLRGDTYTYNTVTPPAIGAFRGFRIPRLQISTPSLFEYLGNYYLIKFTIYYFTNRLLIIVVTELDKNKN